MSPFDGLVGWLVGDRSKCVFIEYSVQIPVLTGTVTKISGMR